MWEQGGGQPAADVAAWLVGRLPDGWFVGAPKVTVDREEIVVVGELAPLSAELTDETERAAAEQGRIARFREDTRQARIDIARQMELRYQRKVAWGASLGGSREVFTQLSVPVMTRLRQPERIVLDTLVDAGVARSRSEALAWSVRQVGTHAESWLGDLRDAMTEVMKLREQGPDLTT
ncbi:hypothetical protein D5S17_27670 [Pseudonocardiaceae bacterium YIM PH 21723]|nr:hypothetical protein D5S17_27670 [Pseudonocardiaceae bacterium YIM PH 21723]